MRCDPVAPLKRPGLGLPTATKPEIPYREITEPDQAAGPEQAREFVDSGTPAGSHTVAEYMAGCYGIKGMIAKWHMLGISNGNLRHGFRVFLHPREVCSTGRIIDCHD